MAPEYLSWTKVFPRLCESTKKWGMQIAIHAPLKDPPSERIKAVPYLNFGDHSDILYGECGILLFDTEEEMMAHYNQTVGEDGPTELNAYSGSVKVYAVTCDPEGNLLTENT